MTNPRGESRLVIPLICRLFRMFAQTGEYFARRPPAPGADDDDNSDDDGAAHDFDAEEQEQEQEHDPALLADPDFDLRRNPIRDKADEDARLTKYVARLTEIAERAGGAADEAAVEDAKRAEFIRLYKEQQKKQATQPEKKPTAAAAAPNAVLKERRIDAEVREALADLNARATAARPGGNGFVDWNEDAPSDAGLTRARMLVERIEAALRRAAAPADSAALGFWSVAARPPWPANAVAERLPPASLAAFVALVSEHFGVRDSAVVALDGPPARFALLCEWMVEQVPCALAFVLAPARDSPAAAALCVKPRDAALPAVQLSNALTDKARATVHVHYVGTTLVPLAVVQSARSRGPLADANAAPKKKRRK